MKDWSCRCIRHLATEPVSLSLSFSILLPNKLINRVDVSSIHNVFVHPSMVARMLIFHQLKSKRHTQHLSSTLNKLRSFFLLFFEKKSIELSRAANGSHESDMENANGYGDRLLAQRRRRRRFFLCVDVKGGESTRCAIAIHWRAVVVVAWQVEVTLKDDFLTACLFAVAAWIRLQ